MLIEPLLQQARCRVLVVQSLARRGRQLVAGPNVFICDACVAESEQAIAAADGRHRCDFCRKTAKASRQVLAGPLNICADCLRICREIIDSADTTAT